MDRYREIGLSGWSLPANAELRITGGAPVRLLPAHHLRPIVRPRHHETDHASTAKGQTSIPNRERGTRRLVVAALIIKLVIAAGSRCSKVIDPESFPFDQHPE